ncbi:alkaline phosphatase PhoX [Nannocystaceae bacterium ST9]
MLTRRKLLTGAGLALSFAALGRSRSARASGRWGEPIPDPRGVLDLPAGFSYVILEESGQTMSDGYRMPGRPDGMACFAGPSGTLILMRNHENSVGAIAEGPYREGQSAPPEAYDPNGMGGVSRVVVDAQCFSRISSNMVLIGSSRNCAGGPSPWGWLSCEETILISGEHRHGYVFVCPIDADSVRPPDRKLGYGRFFHEAAAVDPSTNVAYLSEDRPDGCLYRFVPDAIAEPFVGKLQALAVVGQPGYSTGLLEVGSVLDIEWIDIDEPDPDQDTLRAEAHGKGAAVILRGEGMWFHQPDGSDAGQVFFSATIGGPIGKGQIFRLIDGPAPTLEVVYGSSDPEVLDMPDNITVAPWGDLFVVEDGTGTNSIRWLDGAGELHHFGRTGLSELTGICFSPDGRAMFVNIQAAGLTLVVTGPFVDEGGGDTGEGTSSETGASTSGSGTGGDSSSSDEAGAATSSEASCGSASEADASCACSSDAGVGSSALALAAAGVVAAGLRRESGE